MGILDLFKRLKQPKVHSNIKPENKVLNVLILGGGPIGLFAGYKLLKKGNNITIFEKRKEYSRHNIVGLAEYKNMDVLSLLPSEINQELTKSARPEITNNLMKSKPYQDLKSETVYIIISELELALEKHYKLNGGKLIKPEVASSFSDIRIDSNIIHYKENNNEHQIDIAEYDIIFINDGSNSFYREHFLSKTSYVDTIEENIFYHGLDKERKSITVSNNKNEIEPFAYGLLMIYEIQNKKQFDKLFHAKKKSHNNNDKNFKYLLKLESEKNKLENEIDIKDLMKNNLRIEWPSSPNGGQNLFRMFTSGNYIYISAMVNPSDVTEEAKVNRSKITFNDLAPELQMYMNFAIYYYDLGNVIDLKSEKCSYNFFPIIFKSVKQSCTFVKYNEQYKLVALLGDALVCGNFHAGIVLNRNMIATNHICQLIDEYIDSYPKNDNNELDTKFLKLLFFHGNLSNINAINYIINKSSAVLINYNEINKSNISLSDVFHSYKHIIACKKFIGKDQKTTNYKLCKNSHKFIKFILKNHESDLLSRIVKYVILTTNYSVNRELVHNYSRSTRNIPKIENLVDTVGMTSSSMFEHAQNDNDDEIKDDEIKDDEIKDDEIKDDEIQDDEIKEV